MNNRAVIISIDEVAEDGDAMVTLTLDWKGGLVQGAAVGGDDPRERPRLVGEAALRAIEALSTRDLTLELLAIASTSLGAHRVALAQVKIQPPGTILVGSALVDESDGSMAAARAVMDALNRRLEVLL
jgi:hypothetical protein